VVGIAAVATVAVVIICRTMDFDHVGEAHDVSPRGEKRQLAANKDDSKD
jgi:hypothetical protein